MFECTPIRTYDADRKLTSAGAWWTEGGLAKGRMIPNYLFTLCGGLLAACGTYWLGSHYDIPMVGYGIAAFLGIAALGLALIVWPLRRRQLIFTVDDRTLLDAGWLSGEDNLKGMPPSRFRTIEVAPAGNHVTCVRDDGTQGILALNLFPEASTKVAFQLNEALREVRRVWTEDARTAPPAMAVSRQRRVID